MRPVRPVLLALATVVGTVAGTVATAAPAAAAPTCYAPVPLVLCGGRVVAEPELSTSFHQFAGPVEDLGRTLMAIEDRAERYIEVGPIREFTGDPEHVSKGGRELWVARITDEDAPDAGKKQVAASLSVHGLEAAGREGGLRYLEDVAIATTTPAGLAAPMTSGPHALPTSEVLARTETWLAFLNPDGWAKGDVKPGTTGFSRGNETGQDLNRDYPTVGWMARGTRTVAGSEPETRAWIDLVESFPHLTTSTDVHGELTTPNQAFADLIIPAGQWDPKRQEQVDQLGKNMIETIEEEFAEHGVVLDQLFGPLPDVDGATPRKPANVAAAYDIVGYDDSGFMGDWFSQRQDSVHMDVENFLSNLAPNSAFAGPIEQAHVAAVRGILESVTVEALFTEAVEPELEMKRVAYVDDPRRTSSGDADGRGAEVEGIPQVVEGDEVVRGEEAVEYDVTRMRYFEELEAATGKPVDALDAAAVARGAVPAKYDTLVVSDMEAPPVAGVDRAAWVAGLKAFAERGGQLLLTDRAVRLADDLGIVPESALTLNRTDAGHVDFVGELGDHPWEQGLVGKPSQTYYEVMLGFPGQGSAPNFGVERGAWEAAGGVTVATVGPQGSSSSPNTALGSVPLGRGSVAIFGAVLPQAIEELVLENGTRRTTPHPFGLADYAVTITGGQVLDNVLAYSRKDGAAAAAPAPAEEPSALVRLARFVLPDAVLPASWREPGRVQEFREGAQR